MSYVIQISFLLAAIFFVLSTHPALAQDENLPVPGTSLSRTQLLSVGIDQRLGNHISKGLTFTESDGKAIQFDSLISQKPTILALVYYQCPNLCTLVLNGLVVSVQDLPAKVGEGYQVVVVSIDPTETVEMAAQKKKTYVRRYGLGSNPGADWHFLIGEDSQIRALADAVGYKYLRDPLLNQYAHGSGIMILDKQGMIVKYLLGIEYPPEEVRLGLLDAEQGHVNAPTPSFLLLCYCYNPLTGPYGGFIFGLLKTTALLTVLGLSGYIGFHIRRDVINARRQT